MPTFAPHRKQRRIFIPWSAIRSIRRSPILPMTRPPAPQIAPKAKSKRIANPAGQMGHPWGTNNVEYVDADEASEGSTDEPQRAEEPAPTRQHAHAEQGERQVEVDQLGLGQEEDRDARQEGQREGSEDRAREAREGVSKGRHGSLETGMRAPVPHINVPTWLSGRDNQCADGTHDRPSVAGRNGLSSPPSAVPSDHSR